MDVSVPQPAPAPPRAGQFRAWQLACWLPLSLLLGAATAWAALAIQRFFSPLLLFSLLVGVVLGGLLVMLMRLCRVGHRPTILAGTALACLLAAAGQPYLAYWRHSHEPLTAQEALARQLMDDAPGQETFSRYLADRAAQGIAVAGRSARGAAAWGLWGLDALLLFAPAMTLVGLSARLPYCNGCQAWHHAVRSRRIDPAAAAGLAAAVGLSVEGEMRRAKYRLVACPGGCGPTGLALSWENARGTYSSGYVWLDPAQRARVLEILDGAGKSALG